MKQYIVKLNPNRQHIVPGFWPATLFGENNVGRLKNANSKAEAVHEVSEDTGVTWSMLSASQAS